MKLNMCPESKEKESHDSDFLADKFSRMERDKDIRIPIIIIGAITFVAALFLLIAYWSMFGFSRSHDHQRWAEFGSYISGTIGVIATFATLAVAIFASLILPKRFKSQREEVDRRDRAIELSDKLFEKDFYIYITAPAWEIAVKWLYWEGDGGDEYRKQVCGGMFLYEYSVFESLEEANKAEYQNFIRSRHHFLPYDLDFKDQSQTSELINQLSEHQVLNIWIQFWIHLYAMIDAKLVDRNYAVSLFSEFYGSWLKFSIQLRVVGQLIRDEELVESSSRPGSDPAFKRFDQLHKLEEILFSDDPDYSETVAKESKNAKKIFAKLKIHEQKI